MLRRLKRRRGSSIFCTRNKSPLTFLFTPLTYLKIVELAINAYFPCSYSDHQMEFLEQLFLTVRVKHFLKVSLETYQK